MQDPKNYVDERTDQQTNGRTDKVTLPLLELLITAENYWCKNVS